MSAQSGRSGSPPPLRDHAPPAVAVSGLTFCHGDGPPALSGLSLTVKSGDFLAVIGPNGGGKTTLLRLILGLLRPEEGQVRVFGAPPQDMTGQMGYVPQFATMQPDFPASVLDMTLMGAARPTLLGGFWPTDRRARERALGYLELLGLKDCARLPVGALSGGQRQRALVARALMGAPGPLAAPESEAPESESGPAPFLLLLDEPTASIDPEGKFCFYEFLGKLRGRVTIIVVSHDLFMASPFFSRVAFVNRTLTPLSGGSLSPEDLNILFGRHLHDCPVADMQHAGGALHGANCTHPRCLADGESREEACACCGQKACAHRQAPRGDGGRSG